jgi:tryptophan 2,3-dioxygenase
MVNYSDYLALDRLLNIQTPMSEKKGNMAHDEMLFIIIHQAYELWFKQIIFELESVAKLFSDVPLASTSLSTITARLERVTKIQQLLISQLEIIETMTPLDFMDFRDELNPASGFQSIQFKKVELLMGLTLEDRTETEKHFLKNRLTPQEFDEIQKYSQETNLFSLVNNWLERMPFSNFHGWDFWREYGSIVEKMLAHDEFIIKNNASLDERTKLFEINNLEQTKKQFSALLDSTQFEALQKNKKFKMSQTAILHAVFISLYRDWPVLTGPFKVITLLTDVDELMTTWRYRHALMVQRLLGTKIGTGGSSGHDYLKMTTETNRFFKDLFALPTYLIPKKLLPELPDYLKEDLNYVYDAHHL